MSNAKRIKQELKTYLETFDEHDPKPTNSAAAAASSDTPAEDDDDAAAAAVGDDDDEEGTYFVDEAGNYYYQATKDSDPVLTDPPEGIEHEFVADDTAVSEVEELAVGVASTSEPAAVVEPRRTKRTRASKSILPDADAQDEGVKKKLKQEQPNNNDGEDDDEDDVEGVEEDDDDDDEYEFEGETGDVKPGRTGRTHGATSGQHVCTYCLYSTNKRYLLSRHLKSHSEERPFKCSVCERGFKTWASLQNHVNTHTGTKPHQCKHCDSCFTTSGEMVRHVRYKHTHEKPHKCTECDYASVEMSKLKRHFRCHTGERPYQCPHCTYASPDTFKLKRHLRIHTGEKPYECDVCHARFTQSNSLKAHKLIHSVGDKPVFNCELCPTTCGRKTDLRIHMQKLHTAEKPLRCKRCNSEFADRYSYKIHAKTHEGEKCYTCELCPYASISARHLESHMLIHTDQKPFMCVHCDQCFRQKQLLRRHVNLYHNPEYVPPRPQEKRHQCPTCNKSFRHKGNLIRHMASHDPDSTVDQEAKALKLGRQMRLDMTDGNAGYEEYEIEENDEDDEEEVEHVLDADGDEEMHLLENDEDNAEMLDIIENDEEDGCYEDGADPLQNNDGEVEENSGGLKYVVLKMVAPSAATGSGGEPEDAEELADEYVLPEQQEDDTKYEAGAATSNCFGFDEDDEESSQIDVKDVNLLSFEHE